MWLQHYKNSDAGINSARGIDRMLDMLISIVYKVLWNILYCYPYKISHVQLLLPADLEASQSFTLRFIDRMEVGNEWSWDILESDEANFHLQNFVNTQNYNIWATENPFQLQLFPLQGHCVVLNIGSVYRRSFFFEEIALACSVTDTVTDKRYEAFLPNHALPAFQLRNCVDRTVFMQGSAPMHIATPVKQLLNAYFQFGDDGIISCHFPTTWPSRSSDLNPYDFWL